VEETVGMTEAERSRILEDLENGRITYSDAMRQLEGEG